MKAEEIVHQIQVICENTPELDDNFNDEDAHIIDNALTKILDLCRQLK